MRCPVCQGTEWGDRIHRDLRSCNRCSLRRREEIPSAEALRGMTATFVLGAQKATGIGKVKRKVRFEDAERQLKYLDMKPGRIFDVGAAGGFFLFKAKEAGWEVYGNEISHSAIFYAFEKYDIALQYGLLEDITHWLSLLPPMDAVVLWNTLEHCIDPLQTMVICCEMLRDGGQCIINVPMKRTRKDIQKTWADAHLSEFTEESLNECCERAGLLFVSSYFSYDGQIRQGISKWLA